MVIKIKIYTPQQTDHNKNQLNQVWVYLIYGRSINFNSGD